ncbi:MAG: bis(5'-nucleosyl)-tetraphosphatase (symmetrical) YqeK, partial [Clostridia bacterium]|nr:bis(5'-nucleosyl)-tetraphosphatase (symmetrical) YqeK [Clostridia bacterium]
MKYSEISLNDLKNDVATRLSKKRFEHTLGVEKMAAYIGEHLLAERVSELRAAAILHDVAKELPDTELLSLMRKSDFSLSDEDFKSSKLYHSFAADALIKRDFPDFASEDILSAVHNHTAGDADMSLFDSIIFLSDFIEEGRVYRDCVDLREMLYKRFNSASNLSEYRAAFD